MIGGCSKQRYKKLTNEDEDAERPKRRRRRWVKQMNGRVMGFCVSQRRRLNWRRISMVIMPSKAVGIYADFSSRIRIHWAYPTVILSSQWGLPVLSHPSLTVAPKKCGVVSLNRKISSHFWSMLYMFCYQFYAFFHSQFEIKALCIVFYFIF